MAQVEGDCAIHLLKTQSRVVRANCFRLLPIAILPHDAVNRHTTPHEIEATFAVLNEIPVHAYTKGHFISPRMPAKAVIYQEPHE
jgi:hypothetical protein